MIDRLILFGAGSAGRYVLAHLVSKGIHPLAFADNNSALWGTPIEGIPVMSPAAAKALTPDAIWVATCISAPAREIRAEIRAMGVRTVPLHDVLPCFHGKPSDKVFNELLELAGDTITYEELCEQFNFRSNRDYDEQSLPESCADIYFPDFIKHLDAEHFVDCGAADGDTIRSFRAHWYKWKATTAIEPDQKNFERLAELMPEFKRPWGQGTDLFHCGVGDCNNDSVLFAATGDYSAHVDNNPPKGNIDRVMIKKLDDMPYLQIPTYIKMDIEGSEMQALWGARKLIKEHSPVLAVCAYHKSEDLWSIPLLIHALNPDYKIFLRRYAEGSWELVYYAVPLDRVIPPVPANHESYSDNHEG